MKAFRASLLHCLHDPGEATDPSAIAFIEDGLLVVNPQGRIEQCGEAATLLPQLGPDIPVEAHPGKWLVPGFVDTHIHYVQTDIIAAYGEQLLNWLERYAFPAEMAFADPQHCAQVARFFINELLRNGTTTALVMGSVHPGSVEALFREAQERRLRLIAGKVMMDRHCPAALQDTPDSAYRDSKALIERWHGQDRLHYAVTPRFAPTSSEAQLSRAGQLLQEHPEVYLHTHLAENRDELRWVAELFPEDVSYLGVYERFGLVRERALFAHAIHLHHHDWARLAGAGAAVAHCPTCNFFIGSGLFDLRATLRAGVRVGMGTDVGGGTTFSVLRTLHEGYKMAQLQGYSLSPERAFYLATLGGAKALYLEDRIGNLLPGKEADFLLLDPTATPLLARRCAAGISWREQLFALLMLGDDRVVATTHILGEPVEAKNQRD